MDGKKEDKPKKTGRTRKQEMETGVMTDETKEDKQNKNHT
jgi:hypothetical protein